MIVELMEREIELMKTVASLQAKNEQLKTALCLQQFEMPTKHETEGLPDRSKAMLELMCDGFSRTRTEMSVGLGITINQVGRTMDTLRNNGYTFDRERLGETRYSKYKLVGTRHSTSVEAKINATRLIAELNAIRQLAKADGCRNIEAIAYRALLGSGIKTE